MRKQLSWDSSQGLSIANEYSMKDRFKKEVFEHPCSGFTIWICCMMLIVKHACLCPYNATILRNNDKMFQLMVHMLDNHDNDALLKCMIAILVQYNDGMFHANEMMHMTWCICHDADSMMHTPWCKDDDALVLCMYEVLKIWCIHTWVYDAHAKCTP